MNNTNHFNGGGNPYPVNYAPQQPAGQQPVYGQTVNPAYQPPVQSVPQPVRPVYQPPAPMPPVIPQPSAHTVAAQSAIGSMNKALFVIFSVLFGWICARSLLSLETGVGITVMGLAFYLIYIPFIVFRQQKNIPLFGWILFLPQIVILASFTFFSDIRVTLIGLVASFLIAAIQTTLIANCTTGEPFSFDLICDTCINYLALPFMNFLTTFSAVLPGKDKNGKGGKTSLKIAIGIAISLPVVIFLITMFAVADQMFAKWVDKILVILNLNLGRIAADIILTLIVMLYVMPLVVTLRSGYHKTYNHKESRRFFDPIISATVMFASSVVYLVFVAVQFTYLFAGIGSLPEGLTLAEYSRRGFFELVFVIVITSIVIGAVCVLTKNNRHEKLPVYLKVALLIIAASNAVMTISAARRLIIYIGSYNMTVSRFNAAVLIALMAFVNIVVALRIIFDRMKVSAVIGSMLALTAAAYCIFNVDGFVARYNIDRYLANNAKYKIDLAYIADDLSVSAIPQLERLMNTAPDNDTKEHTKYVIAHIAQRQELFEGDESHIARWTIDRQVAIDIIDKYGITEKMADEYYNRFVWEY